jgi:hypothetical protein
MPSISSGADPLQRMDLGVGVARMTEEGLAPDNVVYAEGGAVDYATLNTKETPGRYRCSVQVTGWFLAEGRRLAVSDRGGTQRG